MPWTEDPDDAKARVCTTSGQRWSPSCRPLCGAWRIRRFRACGGRGQHGGNAPAFVALHSGFGVGAKVRTSKPVIRRRAGWDQRPNVSILGPPTDQNFLSQMDPPANDHYLRLSGGELRAQPGQAFCRRQWSFRTLTPLRLAGASAGLQPTQVARRLFGGRLAFALDQCVNNCSIVALFSYQGKNLLFPGDANTATGSRGWDHRKRRLLSSLSFTKSRIMAASTRLRRKRWRRCRTQSSPP